VNLFFIEKRRKVSVWLGCEQRGAIFGNYWLLIVFPKVVCYKKIQRLTGIGFSKNSVFDARISTSLMYNSASGGNHVVVFLTFTDSKGIS
ncbi:hypothetical protein MJM83_28400, partial [Salmonella enterica subsp. enterica serovar Montevideo]|nr:hypothetical protein [Salmonella enterica subsp. enterica serovar Montevideo]